MENRVDEDEKEPSKKPPREEGKMSEQAQSSDGDSSENENDDRIDQGKIGVTSMAGDDAGMSKLRKEKRLAMNRASARARRKRKKVLLDSLGSQVAELTKRNQTIQLANETLKARVEHLEAALAQSHATIASLLSDGRQAPLTQQIRQHDLGTATASNEEALRALLQSGTDPSALFLRSGAGIGGVASMSDSLAQQKLFNAHLLSQGLGGGVGMIGQPTQSQLLEAAGLGGSLRFPTNDSALLAATAPATQLNALLGQNRNLPMRSPPGDHSLGSAGSSGRGSGSDGRGQPQQQHEQPQPDSAREPPKKRRR